jgi:hypothetical protein
VILVQINILLKNNGEKNNVDIFKTVNKILKITESKNIKIMQYMFKENRK